MGPSGDSAPSEGATAELVAHTGVEFLDRARDGRWFVTHLVTRERAIVREEGPWRLEFDDDGFAMLVHARTPDNIIFAKGLFVYVVYRCSDNRLLLVSMRGPTAGQRVDLATMREKYAEPEATMRIGVARCEVVFDLLVVRFPRHGATPTSDSGSSAWTVGGGLMARDPLVRDCSCASACQATCRFASSASLTSSASTPAQSASCPRQLCPWPDCYCSLASGLGPASAPGAWRFTTIGPRRCTWSGHCARCCTRARSTFRSRSTSRRLGCTRGLGRQHSRSQSRSF